MFNFPLKQYPKILKAMYNRIVNGVAKQNFMILDIQASYGLVTKLLLTTHKQKNQRKISKSIVTGSNQIQKDFSFLYGDKKSSK